jgi:hypothetical protein
VHYFSIVSEYAEWKMMHVLNFRRALDGDTLRQAGIDCESDTWDALIDPGLIEVAPGGNVVDGPFQLTRASRSLLERFVIARRSLGRSDIRVDCPTAFVEMPFSEEWSAAVYSQLIQPSATSAGLSVVRGDEVSRASGSLIANVWDAIAKAGIVMADLSADNPNVFYEVGLAHALGRPTFCLRQTTARALPADFGGAHYIEYDLTDIAPGLAELITQLETWKSEAHADFVEHLYG